MNQFCLRVSGYFKLWKGENTDLKKKKNKKSCTEQTTEHCYRELIKILLKLIVSPHIHTLPFKNVKSNCFSDKSHFSDPSTDFCFKVRKTFKGKPRRAFGVHLYNFSADVVPSGGLKL